MALTQLAPTYPIFTDKNGDPLDAGFLYFGSANQNPETNPIQVYYDRGFTQPVAQPVRTSNGYVMRNGSPALIYADSASFSVTVRNKKNELVIYSPTGFGVVPGIPFAVFENAAKNVADLVADTQFTYNAGISGTVQVAAGDILRTLTEGFAYEVAASGATDEHVTTAGGVKLYVQALGEIMPLAAFAPAGDGVTDDTSVLQAAAAAATAAKVALYVPAGTYILNDTLSVTHGINGAGRDDVLFQGVDDGTLRTFLVKIDGSGVYEGFTVDGACSADPISWNSSNYDSFTGWGRTLGVYADDVIVRNVHVQNSVRACVDSDAITTRNLFENVTTNRSRGNFGDGFYMRRSSNVTYINCRAYDYTRIGFVNEGDNTAISENVKYINCHAEFGHDQSADYGGGEFNCGFWAENSAIVSYENCTAKNNTDRGFTYAATGNLPIFGHDHGQVVFTNCDAYDTNSGFAFSSLDAGVRASGFVENCAAYQCRSGVGSKRADIHLMNFSWLYDGGSSQTRAVSASDDARIWINGLYTKWTNIPTDGGSSDPLSQSNDTATISRFSTEQPLFVSVENANTHDGTPITVKFRAAANNLRVEIKNTKFSCPIMLPQKGIYFKNCEIDAKGTGAFASYNDLGRNSSIDGCEIDTTDGPIFFGIGPEGDLTLRDTKIKRGAGGSYVYLFFVALAVDPYTVATLENCTLIGDVEADEKLIRVNNTFGETRTGDVYVSNCRFINTGGSTANPAMVLERSAGDSTVFANGVWKSNTITNLATRTAAGSVVNDIP